MIKIINRLIRQLNAIGKQNITKCFKFYQKSNSKLEFLGVSSRMSKARNIKSDNNFFDCKVIHWFDNIWLYIRINFNIRSIFMEPSWDKEKREEYINSIRKNFIHTNNHYCCIFITISVFQGEPHDDIKTQLFRAEWDNRYEEEHHPQPHWHIYPNKYSTRTHKNFEDFIGLSNEDEDFHEFLDKEHDIKIIDIKKIHFAMNAQWSENDSDVHKIQQEDELLRWFSGVLSHIKGQLQYVCET